MAAVARRGVAEVWNDSLHECLVIGVAFIDGGAGMLSVQRHKAR